MTQLKKAAAIFSTLFCAGIAHAADVNVGFNSVTGGNVTGVSFAYDGAFPGAGQYWKTQTAYWYGTDKSILFEFDKTYSVNSFDISLDNNDSYSVQFSMDGSLWGSTVSIGSGEGSVTGGMDRFQRSVTPTMANFARVFATRGDNMYSVGELKITAAVPEPETYAMFLAGIGLMGAIARRKKQAV
jgi:hypothetical protein